MASLRNVKISGKISLIIALLSVVTVVVAISGYYGLTVVSKSVESVSRYGRVSDALSRMRYEVAMVRVHYLRDVNSTDAATHAQTLQDIATAKKNFDELVELARQTTRVPARRAHLDEVSALFNQFVESTNNAATVNQ